jgi:hypothetical protein
MERKSFSGRRVVLVVIVLVLMGWAVFMWSIFRHLE